MKRSLFALAVISMFTGGSAVFAKDAGAPEAYVIASAAMVRTEPTFDSGTAKTALAAGQKVTIIRRIDKTYERNGIVRSWYEVSYAVEGHPQKGFVWGGHITFDAIPFSDGHLILIGVTSFKPNAGYSLVVRILDKDAVVSTMPFVLFGGESAKPEADSALKMDFYDNLGLADFDHIIRIALNVDSVKGTRFRTIVGVRNGASMFIAREEFTDQPVAGGRSSLFIFPNEKDGQPGCVVNRVIEYGPGKGSDKPVVVKDDRKVLVWNADGAELVAK